MTEIENIVTIIATFAGLSVLGYFLIGYKKGQDAIDAMKNEKIKADIKGKEDEISKKIMSQPLDDLVKSSKDLASRVRSRYDS